MVQLDRNFMVKHRDFAVELPKLNVVTIKKPFCAFHGLGIVGAIERHRPVKMAVRTDEVKRGIPPCYYVGFGTSFPSLTSCVTAAFRPSSPESQPCAFELNGSDAITLVSTWSHLGYSKT